MTVWNVTDEQIVVREAITAEDVAPTTGREATATRSTCHRRADAAVGHGHEAHGRGVMVTERPLVAESGPSISHFFGYLNVRFREKRTLKPLAVKFTGASKGQIANINRFGIF